MNTNYQGNPRKKTGVIVVCIVVLLLGVGAFGAYRVISNHLNKQEGNVYLDDDYEDDYDTMDLEEQLQDYEFTPINTYDESTNGEEFLKNGENQFYQDFKISGDYILHINYNGSICMNLSESDNNTCDILKEKEANCKKCDENIIYANYLYEVEGTRSNSKNVYIIDRQGYLYLVMISAMDVSIDKYSDKIVSRVGKRLNDGSYLLEFDDHSTLEFMSSNSLELTIESLS